MIRIRRSLSSNVRDAAVAAVFALTTALSVPAFAERLAFWNAPPIWTGGTPLPATALSPNILGASDMTGGPALTASGLFANAIIFDSWPSGALDPNAYIQFGVTGNAVTYQSIDFNIYNNFDGQGSWEIRSSVDGFSTALDSGTFTGIFFAGLPLTANISAVGTQTGTVTFRLYTFNNFGTTNPLQRGIRGTGGAAPGTGLFVNGTVSGPPPATAQPVPTLGAIPLAVLAVMVAALAFAMRRRMQR